MAKSLIITEKPSVAQEFARILGVSGRNDGYIENGEYVITWCVGHLVEMVYPEEYDEKYKKWKLEDLPFLPKEYKYNVIPNVSKQYDIVHRMLHREDVERVYWAGDAGKEGQTIEENIRRFGGVREGMEELRVWIDSQTEEEILRGMREARPMAEYDNLANSGIMRTIEDYAMGINFSRAMSVRYGKLLNDAAATTSYTAIAVGRVMTCVLGMVVIREREIRGFTETPFYRVVGAFGLGASCKEGVLAKEEGMKSVSETNAGQNVLAEAEWKAVNGSKYFESPLLYKENGFKKQESAELLIGELTGRTAITESIEKGISKKKAPLLFNLAELQAECSKRYKISPDETLQIAQDLYERKLTTYPRTDARVLSAAVAKEISRNISRLKGYEPTQAFVEKIMKERLYANIANTQYTDDSKITDHYAIIPTGQLTELNSLNELQKKVFDLIVRRFLSIFYPPAEYQTVKLVAAIGKERLFASAKELKVLGFLEILGKNIQDEKENKEQDTAGHGLLALAGYLKKGEELAVNGFSIREGKTSPPKRYTSGSMVLAMENAGQLIEDEELRAQIKGSGIGTSATRAEIIKKLIRIGYLNLNKKTQVLSPEKFGEMIFEVVSMTVPALLNPKMTASWEKGLDGITKGTVRMDDYRGKLEDFIHRETSAMIEKDLTGQLAKQIGPFVGKEGKGLAARHSISVSCPICGGDVETTPFGYGCSNYKKDGSGCRFSIGTIAGRELNEEEVKMLLTKGRTGVLNGFVSKSKKKFDASLILERDEEDKISVNFDFSQNEAEILPGVKCPMCGGAIQKKSFGYGCANYEQQDPESCRFAIGTLAEKDLTAAQVTQLLTEGRTETIRGFKSKAGKKFDACIALVTDEEGRKNLKFDFEHVEAKKVKDVQCPLCKGDIVQTPFGFGCASYSRDDPDSCRFSIGKMAEKSLTEAQVKELLTNGRTGTIRGFKSKAGKKFDARVSLQKDETGKVTGLKFDFEDLEVQKIKGVKCPLCGGEIAKTPFGYGCADYSKDNPDSCRFSIGKIAGVTLKESQVKELLSNGKTEVVKGFIAKTGMKFDAPLKLTAEGQVAFDFPERPEPVETMVKCPNCEKKLKKSQWYYECDCGYKLSHTVAQVALPEDVIQELLTSGKTKAKIVGFVSRAGNQFDTCLKLENGKIQFDFDNPGIEPEGPKRMKTEPAMVTKAAEDEFAVYAAMAGDFAALQEEEAAEQMEGGNFLEEFVPQS